MANIDDGGFFKEFARIERCLPMTYDSALARRMVNGEPVENDPNFQDTINALGRSAADIYYGSCPQNDKIREEEE